MSPIAMERIHFGQLNGASLLEGVKAFTLRARDRVLEIALPRASVSRHTLAINGDSCLIKKEPRDGEFCLCVAVPGFSKEDLAVTVMPGELEVAAGCGWGVCCCEFDEKHLLRRFNLPRSIDLDDLTVRLENGVLQVTAAKTQNSDFALSA